MNLAPIIQRLDDECPALLLVGGAAEWEQAIQALTTAPAAFVLPARKRATPSPFMDQLVEQEVESVFSVLIAIRNLADPRGAAAHDDLQPVADQIQAALLNWPPAAAYYGCEYVAGDLMPFANGYLWWAESYRTRYTIRST